MTDAGPPPPELAGFAEAGVVSLADHRALNGATAALTDVLTLTAQAPSWSYVLSLPVPQPAEDGLYAAEVRGRVRAGRVTLGILLDDRTTVRQERILSAGDEGPWLIAAGSLRGSRALLVRTVEPPPVSSTLEIASVRWWRSPLECSEMPRSPVRRELQPIAGWHNYYGVHGSVPEQLRGLCFDRLDVPTEMPWLFGLRVVVFPGEQMSRAVFVSGQYEPGTMLAMRRLVERGAVVVDGGANVGFMSLALARWVGEDGRVLAFEPSSREYGRLVDHVRLNELANVDARRLALGAAGGQRTLQVADAHHSGLNTLGSRFAYDSVTAAIREDVTVTTLDRAVAESGADRVDLVKLDVEGAEYDALRGATDTIRRFRPALVFEANEAALAANGQTLSELERLIRSYGYEILAIRDDGTLAPAAGLTAAAENYVSLPRAPVGYDADSGRSLEHGR